VQLVDREGFIFVEKVCNRPQSTQPRGFAGHRQGLSTLLSTGFVNTFENSRSITDLRPI